MANYDTYRLSHIAKEVAVKYKKLYSPGTFAHCIWQIEQQVLDTIFDKYNVQIANKEAILDFACGTGRATEYLSKRFNNKNIFGVDISESMLEVAKNNLRQQKNVQFILGDMTQDKQIQQQLKKEGIGLITAFRFFLNAEPSLRDSALEAFKQVSDEFYLVFNIHGLVPSLLYFEHLMEKVKRLRDKNREHYALNKLTHRQVIKMLEDHGFTYIKRFPVTYTIPRMFRFVARNKCSNLKKINFSFLSKLMPTQAIYVAKFKKA